ncbi:MULTISPECIES: peptidylprolyl isomerase [Rhodococcus]|uniref:Peptidylprolyl isomerase n=2 Tax=Rhodococcus aetherivorans TaxID=191292 RepID=N1M8P3_9NOCA|nr:MULTISPECIES: peptidylprolyl isomerase [Rhodococcus]ANZ25346.1 cyclophilin [Rhodococcus sp. WB1]KDE13390.1 cyclophilin [Rhodococcus aetherivorans]UYF92087.1 peptidylprolyl isomerase [Rhodococcus aetherivorans]WFS14174.1 peptidylprolyl isomerase [Rhodococcus aetherivorans]WKX01166.1 peptidylprolyl isomerase [Rhodococcus aetherivorans]
MTSGTSIAARLAATLGAALAAAACAASDTGPAPAALRATTTAAATSPGFDPSAYVAMPPRPEPAAATVACAFRAAGPAARTATVPASTSVPATGTVELTLTTSAGPVPLVLERAAAPCAVQSFVGLARQGFFDGTECHHVTDEPGMQMFRCGDPTGSGTGGPGYTFADEYPVTVVRGENGYLPSPVVYPRGTVAMANAGHRDSNGSQFLLVFGDSLLQPQYSVFGTVGEPGLRALEEVAAAGDDGSSPLGGGRPLIPMRIVAVG